MKLSDINNRDNITSLLESFLCLQTIKEAVWPIEWSEAALKNPKFIGWLQSLGISGKIQKPREGGVGRAYQIGDSYIVKFTTDYKEASAAAIISKNENDYSAKVYGVRRIGSYTLQSPVTRKVDFYVIVMERLNVGVGKKFRIAGSAVYGYLDHNSGQIENPKAAIRVIKSKYLNKKYINDQGINIAIDKLVNSLYALQQKTGVLSQDPHGGNLAFKNRNPAFFDFGRSSVDLQHPLVQDTRVTSL